MRELRLWSLMAVLLAVANSARAGDVRVEPAQIALDRPEVSQQIVVSRPRPETANAAAAADRREDLTRSARYRTEPAGVVTIDERGLVRPVSDGHAELIIATQDGETRVPVVVTGQSNPPPISFEREIVPLLNKGRCNAGGCHGKAEGQNGFKLSLLGFDPDFDYLARTQDSRGRRLDLTRAAQSLLLLKATALMPHGGGRKIDPASAERRRLERWIASGAPRSIEPDLAVTGIRVIPDRLTMGANESSQLRVLALLSDGQTRCVTASADYLSNADPVAVVDGRGLVQSTETPGEAAILVRYLGFVTVCRVISPRAAERPARPPEATPTDGLVWDQLAALRIPASDLADDATFLRRVYLDVIGTLPTADEARRFLTDSRSDKRAHLIDELLQRPEYADYWGQKWTDLLKADKLKITPQGTVGLTRWLRKQFKENRPYDQMVREILTAQGPVQAESPAAVFKSLDQPEVASRAISQLFFGVRIECAQCHHHPSENWGQDDYAGLAGFFSGVKVKRLPDGTEAIVSRGGTDLPHPRTGQIVPARALGGKPPVFAAGDDRREALADWLLQPDNPFLARVIVNRLWAHYLGRGLVEPIDDFRLTNPPTNDALLAALISQMQADRYDLKAFTRRLLNSRVYQLRSQTVPGNEGDQQHYSHYLFKALPAEVLLDAVCQSTEIPEKFNGWPVGVRSIEIWDNRMPSYFFRIFGRPVRATVCECERSNQPSISQALHLLNSPEMQTKVGHPHGRVRRLVEAGRSNEEIRDELYLSTLSRWPTDEEKAVVQELFQEAGSDRVQAAEDLLWSLLNTKEYLYNH